MRLLILAALVALATAAPFKSTRIRPRLDGRIVGGESTTIQEHPHQLSLQYSGSHICGASLISEKFAVTAAHCTDGTTADTLTIRAGATERGSGGTVVKVLVIHQNPDYDAWLIDYDISVLELEPLTFSETINSIALPEQDEVVTVGSDAVCTGWGATIEGGTMPLTLQTVTVIVVSQSFCNEAYGGGITDRMLCASVPEGGKDACQGDSGGPLVVGDKLVGVVSWGRGCGRPDYPGVYSSVPNLRSFIKDTSDV